MVENVGWIYVPVIDWAGARPSWGRRGATPTPYASAVTMDGATENSQRAQALWYRG